MLHKDSFIIHPKTFSLIQQLQALPELKEFYLVGGTALALQLGHRNSIDIDLFTRNEFVSDQLFAFLNTKFEGEISFQMKNTLLCNLNNIKTDFIRHDYPFVKSPITEEGITFLSCEDIAAMKLNAILNSGKRLKDFVDIYFLLEHFSIQQMLEFFTKKYPHMNPLIALKAVAYFGDIDPEMDAPKMKTKLPIPKIQQRIEQAVLHSTKTF